MNVKDFGGSSTDFGGPCGDIKSFDGHRIWICTPLGVPQTPSDFVSTPCRWHFAHPEISPRPLHQPFLWPHVRALWCQCHKRNHQGGGSLLPESTGRMLKFSSMTLTYPPWKLLVTYPLEKMMVGRWNFLLKLVPFQGTYMQLCFLVRFGWLYVIVIFYLCLCLSFAYPNRCYVDLYDTHTHLSKGSLVGKLPSYGLQKMGGELERKGTERKSHGSWGVTFRWQVSWQQLTCQFTTSSHHIAQPHCIITTSHLITSHQTTAHNITYRNHITSHPITSHWHNMTITSHHIISSDLTLRPTTWHHTASYRFPHHITTKKRNQPTTKTPPDGTAQGCCALKNSVWLVALRAFYRQFLCL